MKNKLNRKTLFYTLIVGSFGLAGLFVLIIKAEVIAPTPSDRPYVNLSSDLNNVAEAKAANNDQKVQELAKWYKHIHGEASNPSSFSLGTATKNSSTDKTFAQRLSLAGVIASQYRNGSYVSQASGTTNKLFYEAKNLETTAPLAIGTFWPGDYVQNVIGNNASAQSRLTSPITVTNTTVSISASTGRPSNTAETWPFINSKDSNSNGYSDSSADYISWIRIDDEILQITSSPVNNSGTITFNVKRGIWGTNATSHSSSARVFSPTYIGNKTAAGSDQGLAGSPNVNDPNKSLRYSIKIWKPQGYNWIANQILDTFGAELQGYNAVHLDVSSCNQYNNAASDGSNVFNWSEDLGAKIQRDQWGQYQKIKVEGLRAKLPGIKMIGNNYFGASAAQNNTCTNDLLANTYDLGNLEHWMKADNAWNLDYSAAMDQNFKIQVNNWPALYWVRWNYDYNGNIDQYKRFSYGSLLLALRSANDKYQYGGAWGAGKPDQMYFYDFGLPLTNPVSLNDVLVPGTQNLYTRQFSNGRVLVNSSNTEKTYPLSKPMFKLLVNGSPTLVSDTVTVPPLDSVLLLDDKASDGGGGGGSDGQVILTEPGGLQVTPKDKAVTLSWDNTNTYKVDYVVSYKKQLDNLWIWPGVTEATDYTISNLEYGTTYDFRVRARHIDSNGVKYLSTDSLTSYRLSDTSAPTAPQNLSATWDTANNNVSLQFGQSSDNDKLSKYIIYRNGVSIGFVTEGLESLTSITYIDNSALPNTTYQYSVKAMDAAGNLSVSSNVVSFVTPSLNDVTAPSAPSLLTGAAVNASQINLTWEASTDNIGVARYDLYRNGIYVASTQYSSFGDTGLKDDTSYNYYVIAKDVAGNSSVASNTFTARTLPLPPPTQLQYGAVYGKVTGSTTGNPIKGAKVSVDTASGKFITRTNSDGNYVINISGSANFNVKYSASNYLPQTLNIYVSPGLYIKKDVILQYNK